jgi:hypothetical protein
MDIENKQNDDKILNPDLSNGEKWQIIGLYRGGIQNNEISLLFNIDKSRVFSIFLNKFYFI